MSLLVDFVQLARHKGFHLGLQPFCAILTNSIPQLIIIRSFQTWYSTKAQERMSIVTMRSFTAMSYIDKCKRLVGILIDICEIIGLITLLHHARDKVQGESPVSCIAVFFLFCPNTLILKSNIMESNCPHVLIYSSRDSLVSKG